MARHIGIVACSAEEAALCYRTVCLEGSQWFGPLGHPEVSMHNHSFASYMRNIDSADWPGVAELMLSSANKLARAGANFLICPDNTIHQAFDLVASELVRREASVGDPQAVRDRLAILEGLPVLSVTQQADDLARALVSKGAVPSAEPEDALHIAIAVVNGIEYLVTWNLRHIANATMRSKIHGACTAEGYDPSTICTPEELLEPDADVG